MWIKLCGMTRASDLQVAVEAGADAVGLILVPQSPRFVDVEQARALARLARTLRPDVRVVGVFTQPDPQQVVQMARLAQVDLVQLHGGQDEEARHAIEQAGFPCIRTVWPAPETKPTPPAGGNAAAPADGAVVGRADAPSNGSPPPGSRAGAGRPPWAFLLDRRTDRLPGGTGLSHDPVQAAHWVRALSGQAPVILAGGLRPDNVVGFLQAVRPWGVDASSGIEVPGRPGVKDPGAIRAFVQAVRAWEEEHATDVIGIDPCRGTRGGQLAGSSR